MTKILIADDNGSIREFCRRELEDEGYLVLDAKNGSEAVALTDRYRPDLVVLDVFMPGVDGLAALASIRTRHPEIPAILFTSYDDICLRDGRSSGAAACVEKSHDLAELKQTISGVLGSRRKRTSYRLGLPPTPLSDCSTA